jgi:CPA2 family monovalent cation:H+ antiporter-2
MHDAHLILTLAGCLATALVCGYVTQRLGLSPIVGYLLAGVAVGPYTPGFVANRELAEQLAEVGVILLMFGVGLHFHLSELLAVRRVAIPGALSQSLAATALGAVAGWSFGWGWEAGIVFGLAIAVAGTVVLLRILSDNHDLHTPTGHIAVGWLVVEDVFTVVVLVMLPAVFGGQAVGIMQLPLALGIACLKIVTLGAFTLVGGSRLIPWLLRRVAATRSQELFTLTILVVALGIAVGAAKLFGVSMALGAFLAGMVVGQSDFSLRAAAEALPMRDAFAVLFFVSVGMLFDPQYLVQSPGILATTLAIILLGKSLMALTIVLLLGYPFKVGLAIAVALAQIGEFSFILGRVGKDLGVLNDAASQTLVAAAMVSIAANPILYRLIEPVSHWTSQHRWLGRLFSSGSSGRGRVATKSEDQAYAEKDGRTVLVDYGPIGRSLARLLADHGSRPSIIEMNLETVERLRQQGLTAPRCWRPGWTRRPPSYSALVEIRRPKGSCAWLAS